MLLYFRFPGFSFGCRGRAGKIASFIALNTSISHQSDEIAGRFHSDRSGKCAAVSYIHASHVPYFLPPVLSRSALSEFERPEFDSLFVNFEVEFESNVTSRRE